MCQLGPSRLPPSGMKCPCCNRDRQRDAKRRLPQTCGRRDCVKKLRVRHIVQVNKKRTATLRRRVALRRPAAARRRVAEAGGQARKRSAVLRSLGKPPAASFPNRYGFPGGLFRRAIPPTDFLRKLLSRHGTACYALRVSPCCLSAAEWKQRAFGGEHLTLLFKGLQLSKTQGLTTYLRVRAGGRYGAGCYFSPDPLIAVSYTRPTRVEGVSAADGVSRHILICAVALGAIRLVGSKRQGALGSGQTSTANSPPDSLPGTEVCVRSPDTRCIVVATATIELQSGEFWHVASHSRCQSGDPEDKGPIVVESRPRWDNMLGWLS